MSEEVPERASDDKPSDIRVRTRRFASRIVRLYARLPMGTRAVPVLANQMLRSGTSVAANYREASRARSNAEFISKVEVCTQEADETELWLEMLIEDCHVVDEDLKELLRESNELVAIFTTMAKNAKKRGKR